MAKVHFKTPDKPSIKGSKPISLKLKLYIKILLFLNVIEGLIIFNLIKR